MGGSRAWKNGRRKKKGERDMWERVLHERERERVFIEYSRAPIIRMGLKLGLFATLKLVGFSLMVY